MSKNDNRVNRTRFNDGKSSGTGNGSLFSTHEYVERSDDWVRELQSILKVQENNAAIPFLQKQESRKTK
jgi:hypothetical protein